MVFATFPVLLHQGPYGLWVIESPFLDCPL